MHMFAESKTNMPESVVSATELVVKGRTLTGPSCIPVVFNN